MHKTALITRKIKTTSLGRLPHVSNMKNLKAGGSSAVFKKVVNISGLPMSFLAEKVFEITPKTFNKYKNENVKLTALLLEHALKFLEVYKSGIEVFGNSSEFNDWLMDESFGLDYKIPANLLNTSNGLDMVLEELMRIAYGATA